MAASPPIPHRRPAWRDTARVRALLLVLLLAAACSGQHVHTNRDGTRLLPLPKERGVWHFVIFGDRTGGPAEGIRVLARAVQDTNLLDPDLVMTVGDLVQGYNATPEWLEQMREYKRTMQALRMPWYPVAGNHDIYWRGPDRPEGGHEGDYEDHFGPLWYWFRHKNAAFIVLYSDEGDPETGTKGFSRAKHTQMSAGQIAWLRSALGKAGGCRHVFVFLHHPRWITERYPGSNWDAVHAALVEAGNVTAVFAGHIHQIHYAGRRDGIAYHTLATTGGGLPNNPAASAGYLHHMNLVTVRREGISVAALPVGSVLDPREMTPERLEELDLLLELSPPRAETPVLIEPDGSCEGEYAFELSNPCRHPVAFTLVPRCPAAGLRFSPDHTHLRLEPGEARRVAFRYHRPDLGLALPFPAPILGVSMAWLGPGARVTLPERTWDLELALSPAFAKQRLEAAEGVLRLAGDGACLELPAGQAALPRGPFTLEARLRAEHFNERQPFLAKTQSSEFALFVNEGRPSFLVHLGGRYVSAEAEEALLQAGTWHHLAGVYDGDALRLYVDGRLVAKSAAKGTRRRNRLPFYVGADPDHRGRPVDHFEGLVDEVRISTCARYGGETFTPETRFSPDEATFLLLHLDQDLGPFVLDAGPGGRHARRRGGATCIPAEGQR